MTPTRAARLSVVALAMVVLTALASCSNPVSPTPTVQPTATSTPPTSVPPASPTPALSPTASPAEPSAALLVVRTDYSADVVGAIPPVNLVITDDGRAVWVDANEALVERALTAAGVDEVRRAVQATGLFTADAFYGKEPLPGVEPPGRGMGIWTVRAPAPDGHVVTLQAAAIDADETQYWIISPERAALDALGRELFDLEAWLPATAWAELASHPYQPDAWALVVYVQPGNEPPAGAPDLATLDLPLDDPRSFGISADDPGVQKLGTLRCGYLTNAAVAPVLAPLRAGGLVTGPADGDSAYVRLAWAAGPGVIDISFLKLRPDGSPSCDEVHG